MPVALIDTSALVKRYRTAEKGANTVQSLFSDAAYSKTIISLSIVEFLNTIYRLKREDHITKQTLTETIDSLYADIFFGHILIHSITDAHLFSSERIIEKVHTLPVVKKRVSPFDALLIACCNDFDKDDLVLVSSDMDLNQLAESEGIQVINPEHTNAEPTSSL